MADFKEKLFRKEDIHALPSLACRRRCVRARGPDREARR